MRDHVNPGHWYTEVLSVLIISLFGNIVMWSFAVASSAGLTFDWTSHQMTSQNGKLLGQWLAVTVCVQWNPSKMDTVGEMTCVRRCPYWRGYLIISLMYKQANPSRLIIAWHHMSQNSNRSYYVWCVACTIIPRQLGTTKILCMFP